MGDFILAFMVACGTFSSYMGNEIETAQYDVDRFCDSEAWMSDPEFTDFLQSADYTQVSDELKLTFEDHLMQNSVHYQAVLDALGGLDHVEASTPGILFEELDDNQ